jgi:DNA-binding transcriptional MerR regulator/2-polyprenyl-3-methyl-5-hydroxy-6-metoxy-1,4-benzoquinol methylase
MHLAGYYSSGQFAKMAQVSIRTIRFYDKQNILKPSYVNDSGARFYTDADFARLQQILLLKYLGFSLDDIRGILVEDPDPHFLRNSLLLQKKLVQDKIEQMELVASAIDDTVLALEEEQEIDWSRMLDLIHLTGMEKSLKSQYQNASNLSARIRLHKEFSVNPQGWFPWIYEVCDGLLSNVPDRQMCDGPLSDVSDRQILELGCGNGALWTENIEKLPVSGIRITLSDISEGMIRDVRRTIGADDARFDFATFDCQKIPFSDASFDLVVANHVLFYCEDIGKVCREVRRVLKPGGCFVCSAYGSSHMMEITRLVQEFDPRIVLSGEKLYERFGLENGTDILTDVFSSVEIRRYEDEIRLDQAEILIEYILSCHGNQNQYLLDRYHDFRSFVEKKIKKGFHITKDAGVFVCRI